MCPGIDIQQIINDPNLTNEQKQQQLIEMMLQQQGQKSGALTFESKDIPAAWRAQADGAGGSAAPPTPAPPAPKAPTAPKSDSTAPAAGSAAPKTDPAKTPAAAPGPKTATKISAQTSELTEREATRTAGEIAGLNVVNVVPEPVAAAWKLAPALTLSH